MESMRASFQDGLQTTQWSLTPDICSHVVSNPNKSGMVCNIIKYGRGSNIWLLRLRHKWHSFCFKTLQSSFISSGGSQLWYCEDIHTVLWGGPCQGEPSWQYQPASHVSELPCTWIFQPQSRLQMTAAPEISDCNHIGDPKPEPPYQATTWIPDPQKVWIVIIILFWSDFLYSKK